MSTFQIKDVVKDMFIVGRRKKVQDVSVDQRVALVYLPTLLPTRVIPALKL